MDFQRNEGATRKRPEGRGLGRFTQYRQTEILSEIFLRNFNHLVAQSFPFADLADDPVANVLLVMSGDDGLLLLANPCQVAVNIQ